jgi:hypothetical protein
MTEQSITARNDVHIDDVSSTKWDDAVFEPIAQ